MRYKSESIETCGLYRANETIDTDRRTDGRMDGRIGCFQYTPLEVRLLGNKMANMEANNSSLYLFLETTGTTLGNHTDSFCAMLKSFFFC